MLHEASYVGQLETVELLLKKWVDIIDLFNIEFTNAKEMLS